MPLMNETADILGYYDKSIRPQDPDDNIFSLGQILERIQTPAYRWPIRNREERTEISSQKRAIIHARDGGLCRYCGDGGHLLTVDHIIPRSAFPADKLHIADRSDNLISACWDCNEGKSNYENDQRKKMGVTVACWDCTNHAHDDEREDRPYAPHLAFCGRCGITRVPELSWIL